MKFAVLLAVIGAAVYLYTARPLFLPVQMRGPQTEAEIAFATCEIAVQELLKAPGTFRRLNGGAHIQDGEGKHLDFEAFLTSTIFEFTAANAYGTEIRSLAECTFAWVKTGDGRARNPALVDLAIDGEPLDDAGRLSVLTKLSATRF